MSENTLVSRVNIEDVDAQAAMVFKAVGVVGEVSTREIASGYTQISVPLSYRLKPTDTEDRHFTARFNVKPEWLTPEYAAAIRTGQVNGTEAIQYRINVQGLLRGLFTSAGLTGAMEFEALSGRLVGFKTKNRKDDPSRLDISYFFKPRV